MVVLGASLLAGTGVAQGIPVLVAIAVSNIPGGGLGIEEEPDTGTARSREPRSSRLWIGVTVASAIAAAIGYVVLDGARRTWRRASSLRGGGDPGDAGGVELIPGGARHGGREGWGS